MPQSQPVRLLLLAVAFIGLAPVLAAAAPGEPGAPPGPVRLGDVGAGSLLFRTEAEGLYLPAPLVRTDVRMDTSGMINRVTVSQRFYNPTDKWLEAVYVFPLPEGAAVDHLRPRVGERLLDGKIKAREEAKSQLLQRAFDIPFFDQRRAASVVPDGVTVVECFGRFRFLQDRIPVSELG